MATLADILHLIAKNLGNSVAADVPEIHQLIDEVLVETVEAAAAEEEAKQ